MKLTNQIILPALCWTARLTAAGTAHVYLHDPHSPPNANPKSTHLSPVTARLVLAQRAGVEDYHKSDLLRAEVIDAINDFGARTPLFADHEGYRKAFILVEGEEHPEAELPQLSSHRSFDIDSVPASPASQGLFADLAVQSDPHNLQPLSAEGIVSYLRDSRQYTSGGNLFYISKSLTDFDAVFNSLIKENAWSITTIITPSSDTSATAESRFQWGTYEMPGKQSPLQKRQRQVKEAPLTEMERPKPVQSFPASVSAFANNTTPPKGILPACFTTESACQSATRNCTGHGSCSKKFHDPDSLGPSGSRGLDCWSCHCQATKSSDGKRTTVWGGPACQKQDISVQFWLIALFTVGMIFLIAFAVGTIWDMGSQELPSVIGAGVSGPTARK